MSNDNHTSGARLRTLAICGGGNAGHALSVVASQTFDGDVKWLVGSNDKADLLHSSACNGGLVSSGVINGRAGRLRLVSSDPAEVVSDADIVVIAVPAYAHKIVLAQVAPFLKDEVIVGCAPSRSGFEFEACSLISDLAPAGRRTIFGLQTLPWSTRVVTPGSEVNFGAVKANVLMASLPAEAAPSLGELLSRLFDITITPTAGFLNLTLGNPGQHIHPGLMHGHFGSWNGETFAPEAVPMFYADASETVSASVVGLSDDTLAVARALEAASDGRLDLSGVPSVLEWLRMSYPAQTADTSTVSSCFTTGPLLHRKAPTKPADDGLLQPEFDYRYLTEDVPYGLVVTRAIAELASVPTPTIDRVIDWTERMIGVEYLTDGKVGGPDAVSLPLPQNYGVATLDELLEWYVGLSGVRRVATARA